MISTSASWSRTSIGSPRNTGPCGGSAAILKALLKARGTSWACSTCADHFAIGLAMSTSGPERCGSWSSTLLGDCPAKTTSGVLPMRALCIMPSALPRPWRDVHFDERRPTGDPRVGVRHGHGHTLVQGEHELHLRVVLQDVHEALFGGAWITENVAARHRQSAAPSRRACPSFETRSTAYQGSGLHRVSRAAGTEAAFLSPPIHKEVQSKPMLWALVVLLCFCGSAASP